MARHEGSIADISGVFVGHWQDEVARTGCSVLLFDGGARCGVEVRGAAPGTRETDLLRGYHLVEEVNAVVLSGGSAFGLAAADGVMQYLESRGIGFVSGEYRVPIVPAAVLYDLEVGDGDVRPDAEAGKAACLAAAKTVAEGAYGAGCGATVGKFLGGAFASPGGVGTASIQLPGGATIAAYIAVNALGEVFDHRDGRLLAGVAEAGRQNISAALPWMGDRVEVKARGNTTIGVVATDAKLSREECNRLAEMGQDGLALSIRPVHTPFDGDTIFGVSTGKIEVPPEAHFALHAAAAEVCARACQNAVMAAGAGEKN